MKDDNKRIVEIIGVLNAIVVAGLVMTVLVLIVGCAISFNPIVSNSMLYEFVEPMAPVVVLGCPLLLILSVILVSYGVKLLNRSVLDKECTRFNLRFEIALLAISLLAVSGFYYLPSINQSIKDNKEAEITNYMTECRENGGTISECSY